MKRLSGSVVKSSRRVRRRKLQLPVGLCLTTAASVAITQPVVAGTFTYNRTTSNSAGTPDLWSQGTSANWSATPASAADTTLSFTGTLAAGVTIFNSNDIASPPFILNQMSFTESGPTSGTAPAITLSGNALQFTNNAAVAPVLTFATTVSSGSARPVVTINNDIVLANDLSIVGSSNAILNGVISGTSTGFTKTGSGTLTLTGNNTYTGNTVFGSTTSSASAGTITIGTGATGSGSGQINASAAVSVNGSGTLLNIDYNSSTAGVGATTDRLSGAVTLNLGGELRFTANTTASTNTTQSFGALSLGSGNAILTLTEGGTGTETITAASFTRGSNLATALIRGTNMGSGTTANSRFFLTDTTGLTSLMVGTTTNTAGSTTLKIIPFLVGDPSATGAGATTASGTAPGGGFLTYDTTAGIGLRPLTGNEVTGYTAATAPDNVRTAFGGSVNVFGKTVNSLFMQPNNVSSGLVGDNNALIVTSGAIGTATSTASTTLTLTGFSAITLGNGEGVIYNGSSTETFVLNSPVGVTSNGGITKFGAGVVRLTANNTFTGPITLNQAGLVLLGNNVNSGGRINSGTTLNVGLGGITGTTGGGTYLNNGTISFSRVDDATFSGTLNGTGSFTKNGAGTLTFTGTGGSATSATTANGGSLVYDFSGGDPVGTVPQVANSGNVVFKASPGGTSKTVSSFAFNTGDIGAYSTLTLQSNGSGAVNLTLSSLNAGAATLDINLFDLASSASNSVTVSAIGSGLSSTNGILMTGGNVRAINLVRTTTGYGFATLSGGTSGALGKLSNQTALTASNSSNTTNYILNTPGTLTRTANLDYSTLTIDSTSGPITLAMGSNTFPVGGSGRTMLVVGSNDVSVTGGTFAGSSAWVFNYGTGTLSMSTTAPTAAIEFGGPGFIVYSGNVPTGSNTGFVNSGALLRVTSGQSYAALTAQPFVVSTGGVLEIGSDLNGATVGDFSNALGVGSGLFRFIGNSGVSAAGADRLVNFGGANAAVTWGSGGFLTNTDGATDGGYILKLSSPKSDAMVEISNPIALGTVQRFVEVADGSAATDARLSGVLSGTGGLTKTGTGTLAVTGTNTYSGPTTITAGTLAVGAGGSGSLTATSGVSIQSGATLAGTGSITAPLTLNTGGKVAPGNTGIGTLTATSITWNSDNATAGMTADLSETDNTSDVLALTGAFNKGTGTTYLFDFTGGTPGQTYTLATFTTTNFSAAMFGIAPTSSAYTGVFTLNAGNLQFTPATVPEPATAGLLAMAAGGLLLRRRRRGD